MKYWFGEPPKECALTKFVTTPHLPVNKVFVDGSTKFGPWGKMCLNCHELYGWGFGVGRGEKYEKQPDG